MVGRIFTDSRLQIFSDEFTSKILLSSLNK